MHNMLSLINATGEKLICCVFLRLAFIQKKGRIQNEPSDHSNFAELDQLVKMNDQKSLELWLGNHNKLVDLQPSRNFGGQICLVKFPLIDSCR
jgi:hypothetical protein